MQTSLFNSHHEDPFNLLWAAAATCTNLHHIFCGRRIGVLRATQFILYHRATIWAFDMHFCRLLFFLKIKLSKYYFRNTVCMREMQVQTRMCVCPESSEPYSISILCVSKRCRFRQECAYAQSRLSLLLSPYCVYVRGAGSDKNVHMPSVVWAFFYLHTVCMWEVQVQTRMCICPVAGAFLYLYSVCMREVQVQTRMCVCPESSEPSSISIPCVCERCRFRQDCAYAQSRLSLLFTSILCVCKRCMFRQDCAYAQSRLSLLLSPYCV